MKSMVGMALALAANYGLDVPNFRAKKLSHYPRNHVHTRARESRRAKMQGLHNTPDGRIERKKGFVVKFVHICWIARAKDENVKNLKHYGHGDTRKEAINMFKNTYFREENQQ